MPASPALPVIVNRSGGAASRAGDALSGQLEDAFSSVGRAIELSLVDGERVGDTIEIHREAGRIVVGGGDGTLATGAAAAVRNGSELAVLPLGTRNHFARQLGIPLDLAEAAKLAASASARTIDLAQAHERVFINNLSAGAYVDVVRLREASRLPKLLATVPATWRTLRRLRSRPFELTIDGDRQTIRTPLLFVGNNRYEVEEGHPGERAALDDGLLSVYAVAPLPRTTLLAAVLRTLISRPRAHRDFTLDSIAREVVIEGPGAWIEVALDGERCRFDLPLTIRILPRALAVVTPESN